MTAPWDRRRDLILEMLRAENPSLRTIAKAVGTNPARLRQFLAREGISRQPYSRAGKHNGHWNGGRRKNRQGYVQILCPEHPFANSIGYVWEHRLVMEKVLGRYLLPTEVVHHKDRQPDHNAPENLTLFQSNADHLQHELKGRVPRWTPETLARQNEWLAQGREILRQRSRAASKRSAVSSL